MDSGPYNWTLQPAALHSSIPLETALIARWLKLKDPVRFQAWGPTIKTSKCLFPNGGPMVVQGPGLVGALSDLGLG